VLNVTGHAAIRLPFATLLASIADVGVVMSLGWLHIITILRSVDYGWSHPDGWT